jgi:hypothetical protein
MRAETRHDNGRLGRAGVKFLTLPADKTRTQLHNQCARVVTCAELQLLVRHTHTWWHHLPLTAARRVPNDALYSQHPSTSLPPADANLTATVWRQLQTADRPALPAAPTFRNNRVGE